LIDKLHNMHCKQSTNRN